MIFLELLEWMLIALILATVATQIIWPFCRGQRWFPMFRNERKNSKVIAQLKSELSDVEQLKLIESLRQQLKEQKEKENKNA